MPVLPMQERAESMQRVLAVDILHLMAAEGSYGAQVAQQLEASEVWHAYRDQKHDLFLPAGSTSQVHLSPLTQCVTGTSNNVLSCLVNVMSHYGWDRRMIPVALAPHSLAV